ncbi:unnamed protein product [Linum trigynum]|uniref:Uncharacterized protein n=1 Tax=Linum trigynum TaxID=586398 RepID=A0AAV2GFE6_9ROSI
MAFLINRPKSVMVPLSNLPKIDPGINPPKSVLNELNHRWRMALGRIRDLYPSISKENGLSSTKKLRKCRSKINWPKSMLNGLIFRGE